MLVTEPLDLFFELQFLFLERSELNVIKCWAALRLFYLDGQMFMFFAEFLKV